MVSTFINIVIFIIAVILLLNFIGDLIVRHILLRFFVHRKIRAMYWECMLIYINIDGYYIHKFANIDHQFDELLYNGKDPKMYIFDLAKDLQNRVNWFNCKPDGKPLNIIEKLFKRYISMILRGFIETYGV